MNVGGYVDESNTAWHCGNRSYNQRSIGIELANDKGASGKWLRKYTWFSWDCE